MTLEERNQILAEAADIMRRTGPLARLVMARDSTGHPCSVRSRDAACFCTVGVILLVLNNSPFLEGPVQLAVLQAIRNRNIDMTISCWNDRVAKDVEDAARLLEEAMSAPMEVE